MDMCLLGRVDTLLSPTAQTRLFGGLDQCMEWACHNYSNLAAASAEALADADLAHEYSQTFKVIWLPTSPAHGQEAFSSSRLELQHEAPM